MDHVPRIRPDRESTEHCPDPKHWKQDPDLAGVREAEALAKLPPGEHKAWQTLWSDVDSLVMRLAVAQVACDELTSTHKRAQKAGEHDREPDRPWTLDG